MSAAYSEICSCWRLKADDGRLFRGRLTQIRDTGRSFTATVTNDWNGNITQVGEVIPGTLNRPCNY